MTCSKSVTEAACTDATGVVRYSCNVCRASRNARAAARRAQAAAEVEEQAHRDAEEEPVDENAAGDEGIETIDADEYFDNIYGDGNDLMDIDVPQEQALNANEASLLSTFRAELDKLLLENCCSTPMASR